MKEIDCGVRGKFLGVKKKLPSYFKKSSENLEVLGTKILYSSCSLVKKQTNANKTKTPQNGSVNAKMNFM